MITQDITNLFLNLSLVQVEAAARMLGVPGEQLSKLLGSPEWKTTQWENVKKARKDLAKIFAKKGHKND